MCSLWTVTLFSSYLLGLGASVKKEKPLVFPVPGTLGGGLLHAGAPPAAHVRALQTQKTRVSVPDTLLTWTISPVTFLCFSLLEKSL